MYDLASFTTKDMTTCGVALRAIGSGAACMEDVAGKTVRYLYDHLVDPDTGAHSCVLVRFYKTHAYGDLDTSLREIVCTTLGRQPDSPDLKCLTLLATAGVKPEWNARQQSASHQAIPLANEAMVEQMPMIAALIKQLGLDVPTVLERDTLALLEAEQKECNVFYVREAAGSPLVPAQTDFVTLFGVRSVLGFGGVLPCGNMFAVILFSNVRISGEVAALFPPLALSTKIAVLPFIRQAIFGVSRNMATMPETER